MMVTVPEGENRDDEGGAIIIRSALQTRPSNLTFVETKKAVPSHVVFIVVGFLLLLNCP